MLRITGCLAASLGLTGCAGFWDTLTSNRLREHPGPTIRQMWSPDDPLVVLRADPPRDGDERAKAMLRLKEPIFNKGTQEDQNEIMAMLKQVATKDPSPVLRLAAIQALGRFEDPGTTDILISAYQEAHGRPEGIEDSFVSDSQWSTPSSRLMNRSPVARPTGFSPDTVSVIRCRSLESLGHCSTPKAANFLATIATSTTAVDGDSQMPADLKGVANNKGLADYQGAADSKAPADRDVRLAAVRGLGLCRQPEAVVALAQVLKAEANKDTALVARSHDGLVRLTGKNLPAEPEKWDEVVKADIVIAPPPTWFDGAVRTAGAIFKP